MSNFDPDAYLGRKSGAPSTGGANPPFMIRGATVKGVQIGSPDVQSEFSAASSGASTAASEAARAAADKKKYGEFYKQIQTIGKPINEITEEDIFNATNGNLELGKAFKTFLGKESQQSLQNEFSKSLILKTAPKLSILNSLKSSLNEYNAALDRGDDEAAYTIGQRTLKVINSPEGADAIGREESDRLGSQLNLLRMPFKIPGDIGVGRKLPEFGKSLQDTINILDNSIQNSLQQAKNPDNIFNPSVPFKTQAGTASAQGGQGVRTLKLNGKTINYTILPD